MPPEKKQCKYCYKWYPEKSFGVARTLPGKVYRRRKCRYCYRETKQILIKRNFKWLADLKRLRGCAECGIKNPVILDFHHKNEKNKSFTIGAFRRSVGTQRMKKEAEKCEVLCANCHRIKHYKKRQEK